MIHPNQIFLVSDIRYGDDDVLVMFRNDAAQCHMELANGLWNSLLGEAGLSEFVLRHGPHGLRAVLSAEGDSWLLIRFIDDVTRPHQGTCLTCGATTDFAEPCMDCAEADDTLSLGEKMALRADEAADETMQYLENAGIEGLDNIHETNIRHIIKDYIAAPVLPPPPFAHIEPERSGLYSDGHSHWADQLARAFEDLDQISRRIHSQDKIPFQDRVLLQQKLACTRTHLLGTYDMFEAMLAEKKGKRLH